MTKAELEKQNQEMQWELYALRKFYDKWSPLVNALHNIIGDTVDEMTQEDD